MKGSRWIAVLVLSGLMAAIAGIWLYRVSAVSAAADENDLITVQRVDFPLIVTAAGIVEAAKNVSIGPPQVRREHRFRLSRMVEEGTQVSEGVVRAPAAASALARMTVRIVPSTGCITAA